MFGIIAKLCFLVSLNEFAILLVHAEKKDRLIIKEMELDCQRLMCGEKSRCIYRKNWCPSPPCPSMVFCSHNGDAENARMPSSCDKVRCSRSHRCVMRYVKEQRTGLYTKTNARCVTDIKNEEASCAGFRCPGSQQGCILREPKCRGFPCRLLQACVPEEEAVRFYDLCSRMNCSSPDNCFLQRPKDCSVINGCSHRPGCLHSSEDKSPHYICRGMICPSGSKCEPIYDHCVSTYRSSCKIRPSCVDYHKVREH